MSSKVKYTSIFLKLNSGNCTCYPSKCFSQHAGVKIGKIVHIQSRDALRPIASQRKYLMHSNKRFLYALVMVWNLNQLRIHNTSDTRTFSQILSLTL